MNHDSSCAAEQGIGNFAESLPRLVKPHQSSNVSMQRLRIDGVLSLDYAERRTDKLVHAM